MHLITTNYKTQHDIFEKIKLTSDSVLLFVKKTKKKNLVTAVVFISCEFTVNESEMIEF